MAYSLLDAIVNGYFYVLERFGDRIDEVEDMLLNNPSQDSLLTIREVKKNLLFMHKSIWPLREVALWMENDEDAIIKKPTKIYIRDIYNHIIEVIDNTETYREMLSGLMDIYLSSINNKMNQIMKVLTIISTIFIPLTFLTGLYGMNFRYMPELSWRWGYGAVIFVMFATTVSMIMYFKNKKWF